MNSEPVRKKIKVEPEVEAETSTSKSWTRLGQELELAYKPLAIRIDRRIDSVLANCKKTVRYECDCCWKQFHRQFDFIVHIQEIHELHRLTLRMLENKNETLIVYCNAMHGKPI